MSRNTNYRSRRGLTRLFISRVLGLRSRAFLKAEHDTEARPILVTTSSSFVEEVNACLRKRLAVLPTKDTALEAVKKGFAVVCKVRGALFLEAYRTAIVTTVPLFVCPRDELPAPAP